MTIYDIIPVSKVSARILSIVINKVFGVNVPPEIEEEVIPMVLESIRETDKYESLGDVLADEAFVNSVVEMFKSNILDSSSGEYLTVAKDAMISCPHCGKVSVLSTLKRKESA